MVFLYRCYCRLLGFLYAQHASLFCCVCVLFSLNKYFLLTYKRAERVYTYKFKDGKRYKWQLQEDDNIQEKYEETADNGEAGLNGVRGEVAGRVQ